MKSVRGREYFFFDKAVNRTFRFDLSIEGTERVPALLPILPRPAKEEEFLSSAIEMMVREGVSLRQAATVLGVAITTQELDNIERRKSFKQMLWAARHRFWQELGSDPERTKASTIGQLQLLAQKLTDDGEYDKAAEVLFKIAKAEGWVGSESTVNVFAGLSAKEFSELRERLKQSQPSEIRPN